MRTCTVGCDGAHSEPRSFQSGQGVCAAVPEVYFVRIHASTPCSSGSPRKRFNAVVVTVHDQEWEEIMNVVDQFLKLGDSASFELPKMNAIWSRAETVSVLESVGLSCGADVKLCAAGMTNAEGVPIGKVLHFKATSRWFAKHLADRFAECSCQKHAELGEPSFTQTGFCKFQRADDAFSLAFQTGPLVRSVSLVRLPLCLGCCAFFPHSVKSNLNAFETFLSGIRVLFYHSF